MSATGNATLTDSVATLRIAGHRATLARTARQVAAEKPLQRGVRRRTVGAAPKLPRTLHAMRYDESMRWYTASDATIGDLPSSSTVGRRQRKQIIAR